MAKSRSEKSYSKRGEAVEPGHSHWTVDAIPIPKMTAKQLHKYVADYNWDGGFGPMRRVIRHSKCDLGTAMMVFWRCDPRYYYEALCERDFESIKSGGAWSLVREVIAKVRSGRFRAAGMSYNPRKDCGYDWTEGKKSPEEIGIPAFMCKPVRSGRKDERISAK